MFSLVFNESVNRIYEPEGGGIHIFTRIMGVRIMVCLCHIPDQTKNNKDLRLGTKSPTDYV